MAGRYKVYPEYKESEIEWVGNIPSHWTLARLKNVLKIRNGKDYKEVEVSSGGYPVYGSGGIFKYSSTFLYDGESVLFGRKGTIDKPLLVKGKFWTVDTMFYSEVCSSMDARFIHNQAMLFPYDLLSTNTALPSMTQEDLLELGFVFPDYEEQQKIANFLDHETSKIDTLITKQEKLIELLQEKRQAVISHAVTKGLTPDVRMKDTGVEWLGEVPEHWVLGRLKNVLKIRNGKDYKQVEVESGGYPVYGSGGIFKRSSEYLYDGESVLFGRKGTINKPLVVQGKFWTVDTMFYSELNKCIDANYVYLQATLFPFDLLSTNTALPSMTQEDLLNLGFVIPPYEEQLVISESISNHDIKFLNIIDKASKQIELMKERKTALISAAVTGKIDVRDWQPKGIQK
ncbi:restriction endonuclease subunit S [Providencia sp. 2.29]|uniref:restriction endonuclease subunit S n=1 Tax=Providencia sp. 2.29 TaxID=2791982 RepID=UPI0034D5F78C